MYTFWNGVSRGSMGLVKITKRVQIDGKGWRFCKVVKGNNGKLRPHVVLIDRQEATHSAGRYTSTLFRTVGASVWLRAHLRLRQRPRQSSGHAC